MAGLATALGSGAMTNSIHELGDAAAILAVGTNTTAAHPIVALQVKKAVKNGAKLIVANPKEIELCKSADIFMQHKPGTDVPLIMGMAKVIIDEGLQDNAFIKDRCENFNAFKVSLSKFDLGRIEEITGVSKDKIVQAARVYATKSPASIIYCMGITQHAHGTDNVWAISNLALITGNFGKPSSGVNPLRGQNNVQGACDMGCLPNVYPGYRNVTLPEARADVEAAWGVALNSKPGKTHTEIFDACHKGDIKSMYLIGENPVISEANASHAIEAMVKTDFLVVQDIFMTETAELADVVLPSTTFAEKNGTFTNTERRVQRVRKAIEPEDGIRPDWWITCEIAKRLNGKGFDYDSPEQIMNEINTMLPAYKGITYARLKKGTLQWPCPSEDHPGTPFLHAEKFGSASGKGKLMPLEYKASAEQTDDAYPLILTTDRSLFHFHGTMTRRVYGLNELDKEERLKINPLDATRFGIEDGQSVKVLSRRGNIEVKVLVTDICPVGTVSLTFHFSETLTNVLTCCELDPVAKTPATKVCAVQIEPA